MMAGFNKARWAKERAEQVVEPTVAPTGVRFDLRMPKFAGKTAMYAARITGGDARLRFDRTFLDLAEDGGKRDRVAFAEAEGVYEVQDDAGRRYFQVSRVDGVLGKSPLALEQVEGMFPAIQLPTAITATANSQDEDVRQFEASERAISAAEAAREIG